MADDARISPYNIADCKNTSDDALQNYLNSINFKQTYFYTDIKLALGYAAVIISAITFAYDYKFGFDQTKHYTAATVAIYMLLNGAFTFWIWGVEKNIIYTGSLNGKKIAISTEAKKLDPTYRITVRSGDSANTKDGKDVKVSAPFMRWFTSDGYFVAKPFQKWLVESVPIIAEADAVKSSARTANPTRTDDQATAGGSDAISSGSDVNTPGTKLRKT